MTQISSFLSLPAWEELKSAPDNSTKMENLCAKWSSLVPHETKRAHIATMMLSVESGVHDVARLSVLPKREELLAVAKSKPLTVRNLELVLANGTRCAEASFDDDAKGRFEFLDALAGFAANALAQLRPVRKKRQPLELTLGQVRSAAIAAAIVAIDEHFAV
jgi:hypothetical protein